MSAPNLRTPLEYLDSPRCDESDDYENVPRREVTQPIATDDIVLVLAMGFANEEYANESKAVSSDGTNCTAWRDRQRLLALEKYYSDAGVNNCVITLNDQLGERDAEPGRHICGTIGQRLVPDITKRIGCGRLVAIHVDYYRMRSGYTMTVIGSPLVEMLKELLRTGAIDSECQILIPNPQNDEARDFYGRGQAFKFEPFPADEHPLVIASMLFDSSVAEVGSGS